MHRVDSAVSYPKNYRSIRPDDPFAIHRAQPGVVLAVDAESDFGEVHALPLLGEEL